MREKGEIIATITLHQCLLKRIEKFLRTFLKNISGDKIVTNEVDTHWEKKVYDYIRGSRSYKAFFFVNEIVLFLLLSLAIL